jgi:hypothetical protein
MWLQSSVKSDDEKLVQAMKRLSKARFKTVSPDTDNTVGETKVIQSKLSSLWATKYRYDNHCLGDRSMNAGSNCH